MNFRTSGRGKDKGATLVEAAIVFGLLFMCLFAVVEFGLAFKDWLTVSHSAREGARSGATYGNDVRADYLILSDIGGHLGAASITVENVRIYNASDPLVGTDYDYTPGANCQGSDCCDWTPCPDPDLPAPPYKEPEWSPVTRDVAAPNTDTLGVEVKYSHRWVTGLWGSTTDFSSTVEYHLEPQTFDVDS